MARSTTPKTHVPSGSERCEVVVRMSMTIPAMDRSAPVGDSYESSSKALPCSGRCGHCDVHPCKLHAII